MRQCLKRERNLLALVAFFLLLIDACAILSYCRLYENSNTADELLRVEDEFARISATAIVEM